MTRFVTPPDPGPVPVLRYAPPPGPLPVLLRDARWLAVDKPSGLLSVPGKGEGLDDCVASRAARIAKGARIVHRLDLDTSGVMILALDAQEHRRLSMQFERRDVEKTYVARVAGEIEGESGRISLPLRTNWEDRPRQIPDPIQGRGAVTDWEVIGREPGATRVRLKPVTGRSHQLRVHLLWLGHAILGDPLYGGEASRFAAPRLQLHAETLTLRGHEDGTPVTLAAPCPF